MLRGRKYLDKVRFFSAKEITSDLGSTSTTFTDEGEFYVDVLQITGYRLFQYQKQGIQYPVSIESRELKFTPSKAIWGTKQIVISSVIPSERNRQVFLEGYLKDEIDEALTTTTTTEATATTTTII